MQSPTVGLKYILKNIQALLILDPLWVILNMDYTNKPLFQMLNDASVVSACSYVMHRNSKIGPKLQNNFALQVQKSSSLGLCFNSPNSPYVVGPCTVMFNEVPFYDKYFFNKILLITTPIKLWMFTVAP